MFFDLTRVEMHLWDRIDGALRDAIDVPLGRFEAMLVMRRLGPCRVLDVSRELALTVGGTSKLVDRLESTALCTRTPNPDDRRSSLIALTDAGRTAVDDGETVIETTLQSLLGAHLEADDVAALRRQLRALRRATQAAAGD